MEAENGPEEFGVPDVLLLGCCGWIGIAGAIAIVASNIAGSLVVPNYNWVAHTISDLAAGPYENIQDLGFYAFAGALLASALGASNVHPGARRWTLGVLCLAVMAALVTVIGARNEYGDHDRVDTWGVHLGLVYALMALFLLATLLMARGMGHFRARYRRISLTCAGLFVVSAAGYFLAPTGYDGLVERAVGAVALAWVVAFSSMLLRLRSRVAR